VTTACELLFHTWERGEHIADLPDPIRPSSRTDGYAIQALWPAQVGQRIAGWKIAATSVAGQRHIGVSGPLAGPIFEHRLHADGAEVPLTGNLMRVVECEVVFRFARALAPRASAYARAEVLDAVEAVLPGFEVPDSRFQAFERAGEAQLIADCACMNRMLLGAPIAADARMQALKDLRVVARVSDGRDLHGVGANVLGDPVDALVWLVNELAAHGRTLEAGQFVTTGACVAPIPVVPGDAVRADFGWLGTLAIRFA